MSAGISCLGDPVSPTSVIYWPKLGEVYLQPATNYFLLFFVLIKKSEELQGEFIDKTLWAGDCKLIPDPQRAWDYQNCHSWSFKQSKPWINLFSLYHSPLVPEFCCFSSSLSCWFCGNSITQSLDWFMPTSQLCFPGRVFLSSPAPLESISLLACVCVNSLAWVTQQQGLPCNVKPKKSQNNHKKLFGSDPRERNLLLVPLWLRARLICDSSGLKNTFGKGINASKSKFLVLKQQGLE